MVEIAARAASRSMPDCWAIAASIASPPAPEFQRSFAAAVTPTKVAAMSGYSARKLAGADVTSNTRMPSSSFSAPVSSVLPYSRIRVRPPP